MSTVTIPTRLGPVPVRVHGPVESPLPPVLAVHGALVDGRLWDGVAAALGDGVRLLAPDLPLGAHRTPVPDRSRLTPQEVAHCLVDVLDDRGIEQAVVLGNDTGGAVAQLLVAAAPERIAGLVLAGCDAFEHFPPPLIRPLVALARLPGGTALAVRTFAVRRLLADPGRLNLLSTRGLGRAYVADLMRPALTDPEIRADLTALFLSMRPSPLLAAADALPVLAGRGAVVWGRRDRVFPHGDAERLAALLATSVRWLDDAATFVPVDRPDACADAVRAVLAAISDAPVGRP